RAVEHGHRQVTGAALAVVGARLVQAAEPAQVVVGPSLAHRASPGVTGLLAGGPGWYNSATDYAILRGHHRTLILSLTISFLSDPRRSGVESAYAVRVPSH